MDEQSTPQILKDLLLAEDELADVDARIEILLSGRKIENEAEFWTWGLCERLLERSWDLRQKDPAQMVVLAEKAVEVALQVDEQKYGTQNIADLRARAWAGLANAYRISDELLRAELAFRNAFEARRQGTLSPVLQARLAELSASLLCDQRQFPEAFRLLDFAHDLYLENGARYEAGRARIQKGIHSGRSGDPEHGIELIVRGLRLIERKRDPKLVFQALHTILLFRVEREEFKMARRQIWEMRPLYEFQADRIAKVKLSGIEGKVFAGLGEFDRAERNFQIAKENFLKEGLNYDAALISFDLAAVWLRQGKRAQVRELLQEMLDTFRARYIAREAIATLVLLRDAANRNEMTLGHLRRAALFLEYVRGKPKKPKDEEI